MRNETPEAQHLNDETLVETEVDIAPSAEESKNERVLAAVRLVVAIVTVINIVAQPFGWQPLGIDQEQLYMVLSGAASIAATLWAWWKNNNVSHASQGGQRVTDAIKSGEAVDFTLTMYKKAA